MKEKITKHELKQAEYWHLTLKIRLAKFKEKNKRGEIIKYEKIQQLWRSSDGNEEWRNIDVVNLHVNSE